MDGVAEDMDADDSPQAVAAGLMSKNGVAPCRRIRARGLEGEQHQGVAHGQPGDVAVPRPAPWKVSRSKMAAVMPLIAAARTGPAMDKDHACAGPLADEPLLERCPVRKRTWKFQKRRLEGASMIPFA